MKVLIIEDEHAAQRRLEKMLLELEPNAEVLDCLDSVEAAVLWFQQHPQPDLVLLDIHLSDGSSFEIFKLVDLKCPIIFTTAYDEYAIQAFKVNAIDYLLKPLKSTELAAALDKYKTLYANTKPNVDYQPLLKTINDEEGKNWLKRMLIRFSSSFKLIEISDAAYFYTKDKITFVVMRENARRYPVDHPLDKLEKMLDPQVFYRINRQFIVNVASIREMHTYSKSRIKVDLEPPTDLETIISTERSSDFKKWLVGTDE